MAYRLTTPLAAGVALALLAGPAMAGQDAAFGGDAALSDEALGAQRAFGTADCSSDSCSAVGTQVQDGGDNVETVNDGGTVLNGDGDEVEGDKANAGGNQSANNTVTFEGDPTFTNTLDAGSLSGVQGVGIAVLNNGSNAAITVNTNVDVSGVQ